MKTLSLRTLISKLRKVVFYQGLCSRENGVFRDLAAKVVPCVPSHLWGDSEPIVVRMRKRSMSQECGGY